MLQNEYLVAKIGFDTEENEPSKVSMKWGSQTGVASVILDTNQVADSSDEESA